MQFINLTPHPINIFDEDCKNILITIPVSGEIARVTSQAHHRPDFVIKNQNVPSVYHEWTPVQGLPDPIEGTFFFISTLCADRLSPERRSVGDCIVPDSGPESVVRDGPNILGVRRITRLV